MINQYIEYTPTKVTDAVRLFIKSREDRSPKRVRNLRRHLGALEDKYGDRTLDSIQPRHLEGIISSKKWSARTSNIWLTDLETFWKWAMRRAGFAKATPVEHVERKRVKSKEPEILTPEQASELLETAPEHRRGILAVQMFAGLRPTEAHKFTLGDMRDGGIVVNSPKTGMRRFVEIPGNLYEMLHNGDFHFPAPSCPKWFPKITRQLSFTYRQGMMRHSYVSYHYALGRDKLATAANSGHRVETMDQFYRAVVTHEQAKEYFSVYVD